MFLFLDLCSLIFTDEDGKPGRENIQNISSLMWKADHLIKDGEFHNTGIVCDKLKIIKYTSESICQLFLGYCSAVMKILLCL
jgi:hypothetical protein